MKRRKDMKKETAVKTAVFAIAVLVVAILIPGAAFAWDFATHAYIEAHLNKKKGQLKEDILNNRIYGACALDLFSNYFTSPYIEFHTYLHDPSQDNFLNVWEDANSPMEMAFAYGFVSHNNAWGMDSTAHVSGITYGHGQGYVIAKAKELGVMVKPALEAGLGVPSLPDDTVVNICHYFVESGVDFLVRQLDPLIGNKLMIAALNRSNEVPGLLIDAYAADLSEAAGGLDKSSSIISSAEAHFQSSMIAYGSALMQDNALELVSRQMAVVGAAFLNLPPVYAPALEPLAKQGILAAMAICAPDFERELKASTGWVNGKLSANGISWSH
jgi:hypothetical protein